MPIKLKCDCGQVLNVPDAMAGKTGKCPKCQKALKIPAGSAASPAAGQQATAKPETAKPETAKPETAKPAAPSPSKPAAPSQAAVQTSSLDDLLDEAGLTKKTGPVCPKCGNPIVRNAAICTKCGLQFESGEQLKGLEFASQKIEFQNEYLQEAANNMRREDIMGERHSKVGMPWWMVMAFLMGALCIAAAGVLIVDARNNTKQPINTLMGKIQRQSMSVVIGATFLSMSGFIASLANLSILVFAFQRSIGQGFACMLIPFYTIYYAFKTWADNKSALKGLGLGLLIGGFGAYLYFSAGGFKTPTADTEPASSGVTAAP